MLLRMLQTLDYFLDRITMYRLVLYILIVLVGIACILGFFSFVPYASSTILLSTLVLVGVGLAANALFAWAFDAPTNVESVYITALILSLILAPAQSVTDLPSLCWAVILAMLSKFVLAWHKKHIFNPAAIAVVITSFTLGQSASWWVGTAWMAPFVTLSGVLIIRKLQLKELAWSYVVSSLVVCLAVGFFKGIAPSETLSQVVLESSFLFLGAIMLTEPATLPPTKKLQMIYGCLVGFLSVPVVNLLNIPLSPEIALCIGNIFSYVVSPKGKLLLLLSKKEQLAQDVFEFTFKSQRKLNYLPGQYMEWTVPHVHPDSRGNRRYFTIASSPTEDTIRLGVKITQKGSSFKKALAQLNEKAPVIAAQLSGEFILPEDSQRKLAFIAGGIGITPFRSMIKYLIDTAQQRDIVLCYSNKEVSEIAYQDIFATAMKQAGTKVVYALTDPYAIPPGWQGAVGRIDEAFIRKEIPDYDKRLFYLSGPQAMVAAYEQLLKHMKVSGKNIKKDFFPGLV